jgi:hypothetical protein
VDETISGTAGDIASLRQRMVEHPVFAAVRDIQSKEWRQTSMMLAQCAGIFLVPSPDEEVE